MIQGPCSVFASRYKSYQRKGKRKQDALCGTWWIFFIWCTIWIKCRLSQFLWKSFVQLFKLSEIEFCLFFIYVYLFYFLKSKQKSDFRSENSVVLVFSCDVLTWTNSLFSGDVINRLLPFYVETILLVFIVLVVQNLDAKYTYTLYYFLPKISFSSDRFRCYTLSLYLRFLS